MKFKKPKKKFSQNFLTDESFIANIVSAINIAKTDNLIEIGPGRGALTNKIIPLVDNLTAIEIDNDLAEKLTLGNFSNLNLINADVLTVDFAQFGDNLRIFGNLPYKISTDLIFYLLKYSHIIKDMHFMLQLEVVDRMVAAPGSKDYGRLSVMVQYLCQTEKLLTVPSSAFYPKPKVESAIIRLTPYKELPVKAKDFDIFAQIVKAAFNQRRKTLRNSLKEFAIQDSAIDLAKRPEQLTVEDFVKLSDFLKAT